MHVDIDCDRDARESDSSRAPQRLDGTCDTTARWEATREGVDDFRYARAVEASADDAHAPAAAAALLKQADDIGGAGDDALPRAIAWRQAAQKLLSAQAH